MTTVTLSATVTVLVFVFSATVTIVPIAAVISRAVVVVVAMPVAFMVIVVVVIGLGLAAILVLLGIFDLVLVLLVVVLVIERDNRRVCVSQAFPELETAADASCGGARAASPEIGRLRAKIVKLRLNCMSHLDFKPSSNSYLGQTLSAKSGKKCNSCPLQDVHT